MIVSEKQQHPHKTKLYLQLKPRKKIHTHKLYLQSDSVIKKWGSNNK